MSQGGNGRTRILVFYAKLGTKGIDDFVEAILCALQCSKLVTEFFYLFYFRSIYVDIRKLVREVRVMVSTNAPEFVCCVRRSARSDAIVSFMLSFC